MRVKVKLTLGVGLLFIMIALLTVLSIVFINNLSKAAKNVLRDNYNTIDYSRQMLIALNNNIHTPKSRQDFEQYLNKQQSTITEAGEGQLTSKLSEDYSHLLNTPADSSALKTVRGDITDIMVLNMQAILRKNQITAKTSENAILWISIAGTLCFMIAFTMLFNLPSNIADPIRKLSDSIKQIAEKNYAERLHIQANGEFRELAASFNTMAQKLEEYAGSNLAKLLMEKSRIETLINNMKDPVIGLDENGIILFTNDKALKAIEMNKEALIGQPIQIVARNNDLIRILTSGDTAAGEQEQPAKEQPLKIYIDDKESYFEKEIIDINIIPTGESKSQGIGQVIILKNITPFKEMDFAKTNFISTISHELKTPISAIKMSVQLLENKKTGILNEDQQQLLDSIKEDSSRLLAITRALLDLSQVETGKIRLNVQPSSPYAVLERAIDATKTQAAYKHIQYIVDKDPQLPSLHIDVEKTAWVLINFLTNAIQYSSENSEVIIRLKQRGQYVSFAVQDHGVGIESKYQKKIFERYFQIPGSAKTGTGLGLAISKDFIEGQGGQIGMEGAFGSGSIFYFSFPA